MSKNDHPILSIVVRVMMHILWAIVQIPIVILKAISSIIKEFRR